MLAKTGVPAAMAAGARVTFGGVLVMKKVLLAFVAMAFLLLCAWPLLSPADGPAPIARGGVAVLAASAEHAADEADPALPPPAERREVAAPGVDTMAALEVAVRWHDGTPAADVTVRCQPVRTNGDLWLRAARTGPDGVARLPTVAPGKVKVIGDRGGKLELEIAPGTTARAELEIPRGFDVRGVVIDPDDRPFADAEVWLSAVPNSDDGEVVARSGADGTFALRSVASERVLTAVAPGYSCAQCDWVSERRAKEVRVLRLRRAPGELDGVVVDPQGRPVPHARVLVGAVIGAENGKFIGEIRGQDLFPARFLRTDAEGRFRAVGLPLLRWPVWVFAPGFAMWRGDFDMSDQQVTQAAIRLQHGASVHGRATASDGRALAGVHVIGLHVMAPIDSRIALLPAIQGMPTWGLAQATTNGDGSFAIAAIMPGTLTIMAWQGDGDGTGRDKTQLELRDDQDVTWNPELGSPFEIQGRVVDPEGRALAGWELSFRCAKAQAFAQTGPDGEFRCRHAEDVVYQLDIACVRGGSSSHFLFGEVRPGGEPLRIEVPWTHIPSSHFKGKLL
ncbi:MAG TPA: carboxypeptidase-like regulatory domain-containing protein, partial [Planctomycetota bacterium]|nr:carboxypeptidase-like regulatory domain-containing protein [Planctomycetota bacterium]